MALKETNKTNLAWDGRKLEKLYLNKTKNLKKLPRVDKNLDRWDLKSVRPPTLSFKRCPLSCTPHEVINKTLK